MKAIPAIPANPPLVEPMRRPLLSPPVVKEIRALLPVWLMTLVLPPAILWEWGGGASEQAMGICLIGGVLMAALSMGHEYGHRTLTLLLVQPASRNTLWRQKMTVLACALSTSTALLILDLWLFVDASKFPSPGDRWSLAALLGAAALCTYLGTPWVTLLSRHTLGGVVFSFGLPLLLWVGAMLLAEIWFRLGGTRPVNEESLASACLSASVGLSALAGGILGRRKFLALEAVEGHGSDVTWPRWIGAALRRAGPRSLARGRGWLGNLVRKELRLQQLPLGLVALVGAAWWLQVGVAWLRPHANLHDLVETFDAGGVLATAFIGLLAGALACAEERSAGTLEWHLTLPPAPWKQWLVKAGVALGLPAVMGGLLVPLLMLASHRICKVPGMELSNALLTGWMVFCFSTVALHASSVCRSTATAVLLALTAAALSMWLAFGAGVGVGLWSGKVVGPLLFDLASLIGLGAWVRPYAPWIHEFPFWAFGIPSVLNVPLAYLNFRRINPGWGRYLVQMLGLGLYYFGAGWVYGCLQIAR